MKNVHRIESESTMGLPPEQPSQYWNVRDDEIRQRMDCHQTGGLGEQLAVLDGVRNGLAVAAGMLTVIEVLSRHLMSQRLRGVSIASPPVIGNREGRFVQPGFIRAQFKDHIPAQHLPTIRSRPSQNRRFQQTDPQNCLHLGQQEAEQYAGLLQMQPGRQSGGRQQYFFLTLVHNFLERRLNGRTIPSISWLLAHRIRRAGVLYNAHQDRNPPRLDDKPPALFAVSRFILLTGKIGARWFVFIGETGCD